MLHVIIALMPALVMSAYLFGARALMLTGVCVLSAMVWEKLCNIIMKRPDSVHDLSAAVTGLLLAFNLPPSLPYPMAVIGTFIAIVIVKQIFGGLGQNFANPAIVGRIVLMLSFTSAMTHWTMPSNMPDAVSSATPLAEDTGLYSYFDLFIGKCPGCLGEVCAAALILGFIILLVKKVITWHIPVSILLTVAVFSGLLNLANPVYANPLAELMSGGLLLGAIFMATDYVTSPMSKNGQLVYGVAIGVLTVIIRAYGAYPEGMSFAILIMNAFVPLINNKFKPKRS